MTISGKAWVDYLSKLRRINSEAADKMASYLYTHDVSSAAGRQALIDYAFGLSTKYGEAAASLACEMYDAVGAASGLTLPPADPADTASYSEVAKAINGTMKSGNTNLVSGSVARLVKRTEADTTLKNAKRDRAQFAWVPHGDTCSFCLTLASRGWQYISDKSLKNGHAEHIHGNCDCTYAVRFDKKGGVAGYDPEKYREMYENAEGSTPQEKINSMRRAQYAENKAEINEQKRLAYKSRVEREAAKNNTPLNVTAEYLKNAKPGTGEISFEPGYLHDKRHEVEIAGAKWLHDTLGGDVVLLAESVDYQEKRADYRWRGRFWDYKAPTTEKAADNSVRHGIKQIMANPGGILLDYKQNQIDMPALERIITNRAKRANLESFDIMIVSDGKVASVLRYKK